MMMMRAGPAEVWGHQASRPAYKNSQNVWRNLAMLAKIATMWGQQRPKADL
jgi:hypothetical protein